MIKLRRTKIVPIFWGHPVVMSPSCRSGTGGWPGSGVVVVLLRWVSRRVGGPLDWTGELYVVVVISCDGAIILGVAPMSTPMQDDVADGVVDAVVRPVLLLKSHLKAPNDDIIDVHHITAVQRCISHRH